MRWISSSLLVLTLAACASTTSSAWVVRGSTPVVQGGGGAISEGQMKFESAPIATGHARSNIYEFDFQTRVPLTGYSTTYRPPPVVAITRHITTNISS